MGGGKEAGKVPHCAVSLRRHGHGVYTTFGPKPAVLTGLCLLY